LQKEVLEGLMLGDGCLYRRRPTHTPYLKVSRATRDLGYLEWTADFFKDFMARPVSSGSRCDARTGNTYYGSSLTTRRCKVFREPYERWYGSGMKRVPKDVLLTPVSMAVWFADDGNVRSTYASWRLQLKLSTQGFPPEDTEYLHNLLEARFGTSWTTVPQGDGKVLSASDEGSRAFLKCIDPVFPPGIDRKTYWRRPEARFYINQPEPPPRQTRYSEETKREALRMRIEERLSLKDIAERLGVKHRSTVRTWVKDHPLTTEEIRERQSENGRVNGWGRLWRKEA
jgi:hypothetical protein